MNSLTMRNSVVETWHFNTRLQPTSLQAGSLLSLSYGYSPTQNNGNLLSEAVTRSGVTWTQTYGAYDHVNRLTSATETSSGQAGWTQSYQYDDIGNRWLTSLGPITATAETIQGASSPFNTANQV